MGVMNACRPSMREFPKLPWYHWRKFAYVDAHAYAQIYMCLYISMFLSITIQGF